MWPHELSLFIDWGVTCTSYRTYALPLDELYVGWKRISRDKFAWCEANCFTNWYNSGRLMCLHTSVISQRAQVDAGWSATSDILKAFFFYHSSWYSIGKLLIKVSHYGVIILLISKTITETCMKQHTYHHANPLEPGRFWLDQTKPAYLTWCCCDRQNLNCSFELFVFTELHWDNLRWAILWTNQKSWLPINDRVNLFYRPPTPSIYRIGKCIPCQPFLTVSYLRYYQRNKLLVHTLMHVFKWHCITTQIQTNESSSFFLI